MPKVTVDGTEIEVPARNNCLQIVPTAAHAAGMFVDQLLERNAHDLFDIARIVDMAGYGINLGAGVVLAAKAGEP